MSKHRRLTHWDHIKKQITRPIAAVFLVCIVLIQHEVTATIIGVG